MRISHKEPRARRIRRQLNQSEVATMTDEELRSAIYSEQTREEILFLLAQGVRSRLGVDVPETPATNLEEAKRIRWAIIKVARDRAEAGGFDTPYGRFDSTPSSINKITGAAVVAQLDPVNFSIPWTLADNSVLTLDAAKVVEVGLMGLAHVNSVHQQGRALRQQIEEAETIEEVDAVVWPTNE